MAEKADLILRDVREINHPAFGALVGFALGYSLREIGADLNVSPATAQLDREGALGLFEGVLYSRTKLRAWG